MFKCDKCGNIYDVKSNFDGIDWDYEPEGIRCPDCGYDGYIEVEECERCGEYISATGTLGLCEDCEKDVRAEMGAFLVDLCEEYEDYEVKILEEMLNELELTSLLRKIKLELENTTAVKKMKEANTEVNSVLSSEMKEFAEEHAKKIFKSFLSDGKEEALDEEPIKFQPFTPLKKMQED